MRHILRPYSDATARQISREYYLSGQAAIQCPRSKSAGDTKKVHDLSGRLYLSQSGWLLLNVPNALVRGAFDALGQLGAELPLKNGQLDGHISVMTADEVKQIGADKITERGHHFNYSLGPVKTVKPKGWDDVSLVWMIEVSSPELKSLRKSYALTPLPHGDHEFHITIGLRRKKNLQENDISKAAAVPDVEPSLYVHSLATMRPAYDPNQGVMANLVNHFVRAKQRGDLWMSQQASNAQFRAALDPDYARQHTVAFLHGQLPQMNPIDRVLSGQSNL